MTAALVGFVIRKRKGRERVGLITRVREDLEDLSELLSPDSTDSIEGVEEPPERIVLYIDDLDRCAPNTVSEVILAINQFLSVQTRRVIFILGVDMDVEYCFKMSLVDIWRIVVLRKPKLGERRIPVAEAEVEDEDPVLCQLAT